MKKFIAKMICLLLIITLPLVLLGNFYARQKTTEVEWLVPLEQMPDQIDLAVIGSSHALCDIDFSPYSDRYFNFSMSAQTPVYDYAMLCEYEDRISDGATIVMTVSYMSPFWTDTPKRFLEKQPRYYKVLSRENIVDYDFTQALTVKSAMYFPWTSIFTANFSDILQLLGEALRNPAPAVPSAPEPTEVPAAVKQEPAGPAKAVPTKPAVDAVPSANADWQQQIDDHVQVLKDYYREIIVHFPDMDPDMKAAYEHIFEKAREHNWKIIAVTTPFLPAYNEIFNEEFYRVFYDTVNGMLEENGIPYWDYSHDPDFSASAELFRDINHLSPEGRTVFSQILADRLGLTETASAQS